MGSSLQVPDLEIEEIESGESASNAQGEGQSDGGQGGEEEKPSKITVPNLNLDDNESEAIQTLLSSAGISSKANVEQLIANNQTFNRFFQTLESDPVTAIELIGRVNPRLRERIYESLTEEYIRLHEDSEDDPDQGKERGSRGGGYRNRYNPELDSLRDTVQKLTQRLDSEDQTRQYNDLRKAFDSRLNAYFDAGDLKELPAKDKRSLKALLKESLADDSAAFQRISRGNFVDIPKHLQKVLDEYSADIKSGEENEKDEREKVKAGARKDIQSGAETVSGKTDGGGGGGDFWDEAVNEFANDLRKTNKAGAKRK